MGNRESTRCPTRASREPIRAVFVARPAGVPYELGRARTPFSLITRGPMIRRDVDVLVEAARRAKVHVSFSVPTLDEDTFLRMLE